MSSMSNPTETAATIHVQGVALPVLTDDIHSWYQSSFLSVLQITPSGLQLLLSKSYEMQQLVQEKKGTDILKHYVIGTIFYEASTRTACSFQTAALRLGASYIHIDGQGNTSTSKKGETLYDTIKCIECYTDCTVLRHPVTGSIHSIVGQQEQGLGLQKPIINAGDGINEHPTQALLDVYTIYIELIRKNRDEVPSTLIVVLLGDLKHGRTVHSLMKLLCHTTKDILYKQHLIIRCCAPNDSLQIPKDVVDDCSVTTMSNDTSTNSLQIQYYTDPILACRDANVVYVTRIQRERFHSDDDYNAVKGTYIINKEFINTVSQMSKESIKQQQPIVLHPLPRVDEISTDFDTDPRAAYFRQMEYGMYVRMALLSLILHKQ